MKAVAQHGNDSEWIIESNSRETRVLAIALGALGALFLWLTTRTPIEVQNDANHVAAFWLGILLMGGAVWLVFFMEDVKILVDEYRRQFRVSFASLTGNRTITHRFSDVGSIQIASVGQRHRGIVTYHLIIALKDGRKLKTQRWSLVHSEVLEIGERLARLIGCTCRPSQSYTPMDLKLVTLSGVVAILIYCVWYRLTVGALCSAMWFGSAPAVIITGAFFAAVRIFRLIRQFRP